MKAKKETEKQLDENVHTSMQWNAIERKKTNHHLRRDTPRERRKKKQTKQNARIIKLWVKTKVSNKGVGTRKQRTVGLCVEQQARNDRIERWQRKTTTAAGIQ